MMKQLLVLIIILKVLCSLAQFPPPAGQNGSTAIYKDSSIIVAWATSCNVIRGFQDISNPSLGLASAGDISMTLGTAGDNGVLSLGDGGSAVLTFNKPIKNELGWDFVVFENSFSDEFLELAFVEVSSDGINFFRFPATSYTQNTVQVDGFGLLDARKINNLAGKYRALYGTPFDLEELSSVSGIDINKITHVRIVDVVGCIQSIYATYDQYHNIINDPWSTPFPSGGFDLDAIGVIHQDNSGVNDFPYSNNHFEIFPNPAKNFCEIRYFLNEPLKIKVIVSDLMGHQKILVSDKNDLPGWNQIEWSEIGLLDGIYFVSIISDNFKWVKKIVIKNE